MATSEADQTMKVQEHGNTRGNAGTPSAWTKEAARVFTARFPLAPAGPTLQQSGEERDCQ